MKMSYPGDQSFRTSVRNLCAFVLMGKTILAALKIMENFQETMSEYQRSSFSKAVGHLIGRLMKYNISNNIVTLMGNFQNSWDCCMLEHFRKIAFCSCPIYLIPSLR